ncbi:MAG: hypothetical protein Q9217_001277 [Psora testacea]
MSDNTDIILQRDEVRHWTLLVLAPNGFFSDTNKSFPMRELDPGVSQALGHAMGRMSRLGAELNLIGHGLEQISQRWTDFESYFDYILDDGDSLMNPTEHDNLLFDDGALSRSRKYFWAIDCLSEFESTVGDNLTQWEYYRDATVFPSMKDSLSSLEQRQLVFADMQYRTLQAQRDSFRQKLTATRALRDALFNASAVIESRASTRLGENVKLLTFVSIFFLPLAFTTSLWSINDKFSSKALIYVILIVALTTYFFIFNINSLVHGFGRLYDNKKKHIVRAMKKDGKELWKLRGQRFEVFRPKHENPEPSEWCIPLEEVARRDSALAQSLMKQRRLSALYHLLDRREKGMAKQEADVLRKLAELDDSSLPASETISNGDGSSVVDAFNPAFGETTSSPDRRLSPFTDADISEWDRINSRTWRAVLTK